ncbi:hypothetical protein C0991_008331 [Blastosporella zonata]|nr:hypothetical protein C0991_008331 [Blastosporella zonata]
MLDGERIGYEVLAAWNAINKITPAARKAKTRKATMMPAIKVMGAPFEFARAVADCEGGEEDCSDITVVSVDDEKDVLVCDDGDIVRMTEVLELDVEVLELDVEVLELDVEVLELPVEVLELDV